MKRRRVKRRLRGFGSTVADHSRWARSTGKTIKTLATRAVIQAKRGDCRSAFSMVVNMNRAVGGEFAHTQESGGDMAHPSRSVVAPRRAHDAFMRYCLPKER